MTDANETPNPEQDSIDITSNGDRTSQLEAELAETKDRLLRLAAEMENTRRRAARDVEEAHKYGVGEFARELTSVADNLARALAAVPETARNEHPKLSDLLKGVEATERQMLNIFERFGLRRLRPLDEVFNPNYHEVMFEVENTGKPAGTVIQVVESGYLLHDRLLKPARVSVAMQDSDQQDENQPLDESA